MMGHAVRDLGGGIYHGVTGVVVEPYRRVRDGGVVGFVAGMFQGLAGMATKPMVGCLDAITHTEEAVREMVGGLAYGDVALAPRRSRFPQPLGLDGRMMPSTAETACGALLLAQLPLLKNATSYSRDAAQATSNTPSILAPSAAFLAEPAPLAAPQLEWMDESGFQVYPGLPPPYQEGITFDKHVESTETAAARAWGSPVSDPASPDSPGSVRKR
ncbi:unnamed protein product, partial [Ascophyllum nodosum]